MKETVKQDIVNRLTNALQQAEMRQGCTNHSYYAEILAKEIIPIIEDQAPLPESIQWALNSGDGVYRP
jgi:hypothetical protein